MLVVLVLAVTMGPMTCTTLHPHQPTSSSGRTPAPTPQPNDLNHKFIHR